MQHEDPFAVTKDPKPNSYMHHFTDASGYLYIEQQEPQYKVKQNQAQPQQQQQKKNQ